MNVKDRSIPSAETVRKLATGYDHKRLDYWLERRELIGARARATAGKDIAIAAEPDTASDEDTGSTPRPRLAWATALLASMAVVAAVVAILALSGEPETDAPSAAETDSPSITDDATEEATKDVEEPPTIATPTPRAASLQGRDASGPRS